MSFLREVKNFIKTDILGIEEVSTQPKTNGSNKTSQPPVIECKADAPEDQLVIKNSNPPVTSEAKMSRKAMEATIKNIPSTRFKMTKLLKAGLIEKVSGISKDDFDNMTVEQQRYIVSAIKCAIARFENMVHNGDVNEEELLTTFAAIVREAIESGAFENAEDFEKSIGNTNDYLGADFKDLSEKEQQEKLLAARKNADNDYKAECKKAKELPQDQQKAALEHAEKRHNLRAKARFADIIAKMPTKMAAKAFILLQSKDLAFGEDVVLNTRSSDEERTKAADCQDYNYTKELIHQFNEVGDSISGEDLEKFTQESTSWKSADAAQDYQNNYEQDRDNYEKALEKQRKGEALTPEEAELLATMKSEYYTATARGIGQGALENHNMSNEEKANFLAKWDNTASKYSDYENVTKDVKEQLTSHEEYAEIKNKLEELKTTKDPKSVEPKPQKTKQTSTFEEKNRFSYNTASYVTLLNIDNSSDVKVKKELINGTPSTNPMKTSSPIKIAKVILEKGIEKAISEYSTDAVKVILDNSNLQHLRPQLTTIIKSYDLQTLKEISDCSDSSFYYICSIINDDMVEPLKEYREHTKGLCFAINEQVDRLVTQNEHS